MLGIPIIRARSGGTPPRRLRHEDREFKDSLSYIETLSQKTKTNKQNNQINKNPRDYMKFFLIIIFNNFRV
jgi:hypothetical protein